MKDDQYTAHDATFENQGVPVWNVKGPGLDTLVQWHGKVPAGGPELESLRVALARNAHEMAECLSIAYRHGYEAAKKETP